MRMMDEEWRSLDQRWDRKIAQKHIERNQTDVTALDYFEGPAAGSAVLAPLYCSARSNIW